MWIPHYYDFNILFEFCWLLQIFLLFKAWLLILWEIECCKFCSQLWEITVRTFRIFFVGQLFRHQHELHSALSLCACDDFGASLAENAAGKR